jgi:co-chaperonin GroES (HSP10)
MVAILDITPPHEFDGIRACGHWIVAEQVSVREKTQGGLIVPEASRLVVWQALSCGELVMTCKNGNRLLFMSPTGGSVTHDGRTFALLKDDQVIAVMRMPDPDEAPRILPPTATIAGVLQ